jgi:RES domain-containing protein
MSKLSSSLRVFRFGDPIGQFEVYSGVGASRYPGRWNVRGQEMIYAAEHYSTGMLELLVSLGDLPPNQHFIEIEMPKGTSYEVVVDGQLPGWSNDDRRVAKTHGSKWFNEVRTAILFVPSLAARMENNVLINPSHPDAQHIKPGRETPVLWDRRLFESTDGHRAEKKGKRRTTRR